MNEFKLVKNIKKYTKLNYIKKANPIEFNGLNGFESDLKYLSQEIESDLTNIKDFNINFEGYGSLADAIMTNSIYKEYTYIDYDYCEESVFKNEYLDLFVNNNDIDFIKCSEFIKVDKENILKEKMLAQFNDSNSMDLEKINQYIKYFLTNNSIEEKISNIKNIINKFNNKLNNLEIDGSFLAKVLINSHKQNCLYQELENLIKNNFNNIKTIELFNKEMDEYNQLEIPF